MKHARQEGQSSQAYVLLGGMHVRRVPGAESVRIKKGHEFHPTSRELTQLKGKIEPVRVPVDPILEEEDDFDDVVELTQDDFASDSAWELWQTEGQPLLGEPSGTNGYVIADVRAALKDEEDE